MTSNNRRILVTGSSSGIGKAIALKLAQDGFDITVHCRSKISEAQSVVEEIEQLGRKVTLIVADVANREEIQKAITEDIENNGAYWGVVSNAGVTADCAFPAMDGSDWDKVIHTNLDSFYNVLHPCIMPMIHLRKGGRIVTIASVSGVIGNRGQTNYSASKAGVIAASKSLALELAKRKITVNTVAPGLVDTGMITDEIKEHALPYIPLGRAGSVDEVAATVSFLCSDGAAYITREVININGGMC